MRVWVATARWGVLPAPVWFLVASPLLCWAFGGSRPWFVWPVGCSRSPLRASFWRVGFD
jgi:hypothetical protein